MTRRRTILGLVMALALLTISGSAHAILVPNAPAITAKVVFIHHSCGENWLSNSSGRLGIYLRDNNYFVSDTNYGWGPDTIGETTDIGHWWTWFRGPRRDVYMRALFTHYERAGDYYSRRAVDPGGENSVVMFKSCYPNSFLGGNPNDRPTTGANPLRGQSSDSAHHTVANAKGIYNDILTYFATRRDKLFILVTPPPQVANNTDDHEAGNARAVNNWLVTDWLRNYRYRNVAVFDFFNVLTSNNGSPQRSDLGGAYGNHHRFLNGAIQHIQTVNNNVSAYPSGDWDDHPNQVGNTKATVEFIRWFNVHYRCWRGSGGCPQR